MIGGAMLLCAVGAMILLAYWSIKRDDMPDALARDGILALREIAAPKPSASTAKSRRGAASPAPNRAAPARKPVAAPLAFDPREMARIAEEAEETLPRFIRDSREEY